jgi:hypothetical protein
MLIEGSVRYDISEPAARAINFWQFLDIVFPEVYQPLNKIEGLQVHQVPSSPYRVQRVSKGTSSMQADIHVILTSYQRKDMLNSFQNIG